MEEEKQKRLYCTKCGTIMTKEPSLYYSNRVLVLCHYCTHWHSIEKYKNENEAKDVCAKYWYLIHKTNPENSAKFKQRRPKKSTKEEQI